MIPGPGPYHLINRYVGIAMMANNLLQCIHQVIIELRFRKSLAQERLEFRYQIIVLSIIYRKGFAKFMMAIALF